MNAGIKETRDLLAFLRALGLRLAEAARDGLSVVDVATAFVQEHRALLEAIEGAGAIPVELADLDQGEVMELMRLGLQTALAVYATLTGRATVEETDALVADALDVVERARRLF